MKNIEIAELLPNKEDFTVKNASAASIWVSSFNRKMIRGRQLIFGNASNDSYLSKNFVNLKRKNLINNSYFYLRSFLEKIPKTIKVIIVHNRPHFFTFLKKKLPNVKFIMVFHNDPNLLRGSGSIEEKRYLLENCDEIVFVSSYIKKKFYDNLKDILPIKGKVIYPSTDYYGHNFNKKLKKEKIIIFVGKLNKSKGYDFFGKAAINILDKYKDWRVIIAGDEKRESYNFTHERLKIYNWLAHKKIINIYKKTSISVVPSTWNEPFGRAAMESSDMGNALIVSDRGGLRETSFKQNILKKINAKTIENEIEKLIKNSNLLKKIQKFNYQKRKVNFKNCLKQLNNLKINLLRNDFNLNFNNALIKILHIANFDEKNNFRLSNINFASKISSGFSNENSKIINFSDRFFIKQNILLSIDNSITEIVRNFKPDLLLLGHTNSISIQALQSVKETNLNMKIAFWYEDSINKKGPDYLKNKSFIEKYSSIVDQFFITTDKNNVEADIPKNKINFIPVPCSSLCENLNLYNLKNHEFDIFYAISHGVNRGVLKDKKTDDRFGFLEKLTTKSDDISYNIFGFNNIQPIWGDEFNKQIARCRFGLNLSRGKPIKYYSSNRIASLVANGLPTLINYDVKYSDFFSSNEMIFYKNLEDLIDKVKYYKKNEKKRIQIGFNGKRKYFKIFNNKIVSDYILSKTLGIKSSYNYIWE